MLISSILSNYLLTLPTLFIEFAFARWLFHMVGWGNLSGVAILVTMGTVTFASLGLVVASVTNTMQETQMINQIFWSAFLFLSGATLPLPMLPSWIQRFAPFLPATYLVAGLERVMAGRVAAREVGAELIALGVCAGIAFLVSQQLFRWEPEARVPRRAKLLAASAIVPFLLLGIWENATGTLRANSAVPSVLLLSKT